MVLRNFTGQACSAKKSHRFGKRQRSAVYAKLRRAREDRGQWSEDGLKAEDYPKRINRLLRSRRKVPQYHLPELPLLNTPQINKKIKEGLTG